MYSVDFTSLREKLDRELTGASPRERVLIVAVWGWGGIVVATWAIFWVVALITGALVLAQQFAQNVTVVLLWMPISLALFILARRLVHLLGVKKESARDVPKPT